MNFRVVASLLVIATLCALVYIFGFPPGDSKNAPQQPPSTSSEDKALKDLRIE